MGNRLTPVVIGGTGTGTYCTAYFEQAQRVDRTICIQLQLHYNFCWLEYCLSILNQYKEIEDTFGIQYLLFLIQKNEEYGST
jgi:hypothetical protein